VVMEDESFGLATYASLSHSFGYSIGGLKELCTIHV
jgi:hypothetical protein